jgi:hypothetical protein
MARFGRFGFAVIAIAMIAFNTLSCSGDLNKGDSPVELIATTKADVLVLDLSDSNCGKNGLGTTTLRSIIKRKDPTDTRFLDVQLKSYRVSYVRTDGGTLVPQSFVRTISGTVTAGGAGSSLSDLLIFEPGAFLEAPFAALLAQNGGRDPETGKGTVTLDIIVDVFGETISGQNVSARTRWPLTVCVGCGCIQQTTGT